ncbi:snoRNA-binding rRNA-processing protein [Orbilia oligospora]|uniref:SnoRNA-binding rRNA-processing protein n=1 Tax=Orbilia oligospora TaxID=2813651 RepID=A0A7C8PCT6_ORBOL|nr:snoRNA-binding rRNA-processing protein [Orbilia oligospora]KAF3163175.1 snoRNA-binding rRNA-processing protein [Orbilia oligospora]KAF3233388.1 snoRNA-binding rRNA-processing protein [Orbilia oligospora]KAF3233389.1 snoRNA-binding rRNA-processing protein, variant 2 [Orbilia oligospora]KAF3239201.1 snoRNA-binding rRNA-processing protein [Orbilia oligospora]
MPKDTAKSQTNRQARHNPLYEDLTVSKTVSSKPTREKRRASKDARKSSDEGFVDSMLSRKILQLAKEQQDELEEEKPSQNGKSVVDNFLIPHQGVGEWEDESDDEDDDQYQDEYGDDDVVEEVRVNEEDEELFNKFLPSTSERPAVSLADKILEKIAQHESSLQAKGGQTGMDIDEERAELPPKVIEVYTKIGVLLSRYKSGKLPKPFKIIPSLRNWEEILFLTRPDEWSPHACYEATKMFASNLNAAQTQRFLNLILLDRVRDDIYEHKKLNVHLYKALKKALYKPAAFNKGFLFPLCSSGTCTLREAQIVGSVLTRVSIPVLHSAAALQRLCEMDYAGPTSIFIRVLLEKKYALPYKAVDAVVFHFIRFANSDETMPLLWHQSLLSFATRYKNDITEDQRKALFELVRKKGHPAVAPQIVAELEEGRKGGREEMMPPGDGDGLMDDVMDDI